MKDFRELKVWAKAHELTLAIYRITQDFPGTEKYGLVSQMRRSSSSIPTNIAEGCGRASDAELVRFFHIATGSSNELQYQLLLSHDLGFIDVAPYRDLEEKTMEVRRMLVAYIAKIKP
jgi:four helix bundle protein